MAAEPLSPRSINAMRTLDLQSESIGSNPWLKIHIVTSQAASAITERKFEKSLTIAQFKAKLELLTGCHSASMRLTVESVKGSKVCEIAAGDNERLLGSFHIDDGMTVRVTDPDGIDWNNLEKVEKQDMSDDVYDTFKPTNVKPTVREYKRIHKMGKFNPEFQKKAQADFECQQQMEAEARERIKKGNRCEVALKGNVKHRGEVCFIGETQFKPDMLWVGVKLDEPFGKNDGTVEGVEYFKCGKNYGVFVKPNACEVGDFPEREELDFSEDEI